MPSLPNSLVPGWQSSPDVARWARKHKFSEPYSAGDRELREFSRDHSGAAPGLYLWEDENHRIYIGISEKHVATRIRAHIRNFRPVSNIQSFRYLPDTGTSTELRTRERELVHSAADDDAQFVVMNREHAAVVFGDSVFDAEVRPETQQAWLDDPVAEWTPFTQSRATEKRRAAAENAWVKFDGRDDSESIIDAVALYARLCVPSAAATEYEWWVVTCPGWKNAAFERVCTVSISFLEVLWFAQDRKTGRVSVQVGVDYRSLPAKGVVKSLKMRLRGKVHPSGGPFEEVVEFASVEDFRRALEESAALRRAAARFALDRMRTGRVGRYRESHCPQLAAAVLNRANELKVQRVDDDTTQTRLPKVLAGIRKRLRG
ncbi:hypothetical protein [Williamsia sp. CHRR-6]|uniref:hypothetical protein n=1 Tax=Williamsia sp. CHRR-6 TaxID=2835871 RepID=UPI001BD99300|nr:hypothetical protein [Williamsia sp. CHRR-6]MBT0566085.1 hypothetical protein [Williamsia sp. CHRR-6]